MQREREYECNKILENVTACEPIFLRCSNIVLRTFRFLFCWDKFRCKISRTIAINDSIYGVVAESAAATTMITIAIVVIVIIIFFFER